MMTALTLLVPVLTDVEIQLISLAPFAGKRLVDFVGGGKPIETIIANVATAMREATPLADALNCLNQLYFGSSFGAIRRRLPAGTEIESIVHVIANEIRGLLFDRSRAEFYLRARTATTGEMNEWAPLISEMLPEGWTINMFCSRRSDFILTVKDESGYAVEMLRSDSVVEQVANSILRHLSWKPAARASNFRIAA
jgi:hypothetical protein